MENEWQVVAKEMEMRHKSLRGVAEPEAIGARIVKFCLVFIGLWMLFSNFIILMIKDDQT